MDRAVTMLLLNENMGYVIGALVLANSIKKKVKNIAVTIMIAFESETVEKLLKTEFDEVIHIPIIDFKVSGQRWPRFDKNYQWLSKSFTKINVYTLTQYKKVLFLDADMVCLSDFESIFDLDAPAGCITTGKPTLIETGKKLSKEELLESLRNSYGISGACFLIEPSKKMFDKLIDRLNKLTQNNTIDYWETCETLGFPKCGSQAPGSAQEKNLNAGPDESLITWGEFDSWLNISRLYNCQPWLIEKYEKQGQGKVKILHYVQDKPWNIDMNSDEKVWLDYKYWFDAAKECEAQPVKDLVKKMNYKRFTLK